MGGNCDKNRIGQPVTDKSFKPCGTHCCKSGVAENLPIRAELEKEVRELL